MEAMEKISLLKTTQIPIRQGTKKAKSQYQALYLC